MDQPAPSVITWRSRTTSRENRAVAEVGAEQHVGAGVRSADENIGAAQDLAHRVPIAAVVGVPENRLEVFFEGEIEECIDARSGSRIAANSAMVLPTIFLVFRLERFFDLRNVPASVEVGRRADRLRSACSFRRVVGIGERLLAHFHRQEHQILPGRELVEDLAILKREMAHQRHGVR